MELRAVSRDVHSLQAQLKARFLFFSAGSITLDNQLGIFRIVSLASPTTVIAVLLHLFVSSSVHFNDENDEFNLLIDQEIPLVVE